VTAREIVHYLLDGGLLPHSAVASGDVIVVEDARRHFNYTILRRDAPGLFIKRVQAGQPHATATLHREASFYALVNGNRALEEIDRHLPRLVAYDPDANLLVLERIDAQRNAIQHPQLLGETLAHLHEVSRRALIGRLESAIFAGDPPWILSLHRYDAIQHAGKATEELIGILRANPRIGELLDALRAQWRRDVLMHGDVKFDNVLVGTPASSPAGSAASSPPDGSETLPGQPPGRRRSEHLFFVDWEMTDIGDAAWDAASVLQGYVSWWIASLSATADGTIEQRGNPIESVQPAMRAFWDAFGARDDVVRVAAYTGARLLQHAYESMAIAPALTPHALWEMQAGVNVLESPQQAAKDLLGIA